MNHQRAVVADADQSLDAFVAELTAAAYPVALRHAVGDKWLDLQLELWRALTETVKMWGRERRELATDLPSEALPANIDVCAHGLGWQQ